MSPKKKSLIEIDDLTRPDHPNITPDDRCFFLHDYTSGQGYSYSATNNLILNFKKEPDKKGTSQWKYKLRAIREIASMFREAIPHESLMESTLVPVPPSKEKGDPRYDSRMSDVLAELKGPYDFDVRELLVQCESTLGSHESRYRPSIEELIDNYVIDDRVAQAPPRKRILLFDDVLTAGNHFKAAQEVIREEYPDIPIFGIFIARRVFLEEDSQF
ncbi:MAG: hypothetical protein OXB94_13135 [Nitrospira sp.]|nr:hypothetical protein [Nitrospira sp.]